MFPNFDVPRKNDYRKSEVMQQRFSDEIGRILSSTATTPIHVDISPTGLHFWLDTDLTGLSSTQYTSGGAIRTGFTSGDTLLFQAWDVDGSAWVTLATMTAGNTPTLVFGSGVSGVYTTIQDEGVALTQRTALNFTGNAVVATDNGGSSRTDVTINAITSIGGLTATTQTLAVGTGADVFGISSSGSTHTFNYPHMVRKVRATGYGTNLPAHTKSGDVITADANGALPAIDGVTMIVGDRVLYTDMRSGAGFYHQDYGIYTITSVGSAGTPWSITRASDANASAQFVSGTLVHVMEGSSHGNGLFMLQTADPITLDTSLIGYIWIAGPNVGIQSLDGSSAITQTFSSVNDTNVTLTIGPGNPHSFQMGWSGQLGLSRGGTGANLSDPNADRIMFWDDSAGQVTWLTVGSGLSITGTTISTSGGGITSLNGLTGATQTFTNDTNVTIVSGGTAHVITWSGQLGLSRGGTGANLSDPNADRIMFWDDSAGAVTWLTVGSGLSITDTTISASGGGGGDATTLDGIDSTGFLILAGQAGGQSANGGTGASDVLTLASTSHGTKGGVKIGTDDWLHIPELAAAPEGGAAPPTGFGYIYEKSDGLLYFKNDANTEYDLTASSGSVATDSIWDAKGDLAVGTGANTAAKLTAGTNVATFLIPDTSQTTGLKWGTDNDFGDADPALTSPIGFYSVSNSGMRSVMPRALGGLMLGALCEGRLTTETGVGVSTSDRTSQGTIYFTPFGSNRVKIYDGTRWKVYHFSEVSLALTVTSGSNYDVFLYDNSGTLTLELSSAWTNDTTRANALTTQDGVYVKSGATTRLHLGTIRASGTNVTEDSLTKRFVWNRFNRVKRPLRKIDGGSWSYSTATLRPLNNSTANRVEMVRGANEDMVWAQVGASANSGADNGFLGIGLDSTTVSSSYLENKEGYATATGYYGLSAIWNGYPGLGYHYLQALESTYNGGSTVNFDFSSGLLGWCET